MTEQRSLPGLAPSRQYLLAFQRSSNVQAADEYVCEAIFSKLASCVFDEVIVAFRTFREHLDNLHKIFQTLRGS
jgi:hypothetical protein